MDNPEGSFTSAATVAAHSPAAETGPALAAPALAAPALAAPALAAPVLAAPALAAPALAAPALAAPALAAPALASPTLAAPALAALALAAPALAGLALAAPVVWAEEEEDSTISFYGCTKPTTTVAVGGLRSSWPASPACAVKQSMAFKINKQFMCSQKINAQIGESYICQKKFPRKILILEFELHQAISPARNGLTSRAKQLQARGR